MAINRVGLVRSSWVVALGLGLVPAMGFANSASAAPLKIACVGEQTTHSDQLNRAVEYPAMLQTELGPNYDVENFGDCCATVLNNYPKQPETHPYLLGGGKPSYNESLTFAPDVVVIGSWGKHDTEIATALTNGVIDPGQFTKDYEALLAAYMNLPNKPAIYLSTPVPIPKGAPTGPTTDVVLPTVRAAAAKYKLPIVDLYAVFLNKPNLYKDDTHVTNVEGLQTIADTVHAVLISPTGTSDGGIESDASGDVDASLGDDDAGSVGSPFDAGAAPQPSTSDAAGSSQDQPTNGANGAGGCAAARGGDRGEGTGALGGLVMVLAIAARRRSRVV